MENNINTIDCAPSAIEDIKPEPKWGHLADSFLMIAFAVGVYAQIFAFFLYAFTTEA